MMGIQDAQQGKLFYTNINLDQRIRANHPLRKIDQLIDFDFGFGPLGDACCRRLIVAAGQHSPPLGPA